MTTTGVVPAPIEERRVGPDLRAWRTSSSFLRVVVFVAAFCSWIAALGIGLSAEKWWVRVAMVLPLTLASGQLFTIGHDAAHGSFSSSSALNTAVGRLAFVPSMHVLGLWRAHHDLHHRYTNLRDRDFVWTPLSVTDYLRLPRWRRALHRVYRHRSGLGLGLHYGIEIWLPRMLWPRTRHDLARRGRLVADAVLHYGVLVCLGASAWAFVSAVQPERAGDSGFWWASAGLFVVLPLIGTHWLVGFVIYLNHTHPDIVWYDDPAEWSQHAVQLDGSSGQRFPRWWQALLPRRIMNHTAHHVDPGVPLDQLALAQQHLVDTFGDRVVSYDWSLTSFRDVLSSCKLYDYDAQRWLTYAAVGGPA